MAFLNQMCAGAPTLTAIPTAQPSYTFVDPDGAPEL
jgi:hypothetical protein